MSFIQASVNNKWKNWQEYVKYSEVDERFSVGYRKHGMPFTEDFVKESEMQKIEKWASDLKAKGINTLIVVGMGGSVTAAKVFNDLTVASSFKLYFWEGSHPGMMRETLAVAEMNKTALLWISKSGETLESRTNLSLFRMFFPDVPEFFVTGSPEKIDEFNVSKDNVFIIPQNIYGRFSAATAVGIMPGVFLGADMQSYMTGFQNGINKWDITAPISHNAAKRTAFQYYNLLKDPFRGVAFWVYVRELKGWGEWLVQLWAESLGKNSCTKITPHLCLGPEDQHVRLQHFLDGPNAYVHTFINTHSYGAANMNVPSEIPGIYADKSLAEILKAQMKSVQISLDEKNRPVSSFSLPELNLEVMGEWMSYWMFVVTYLAYLFNVNPFDQPAVDKGKLVASDYLTATKEERKDMDPLEAVLQL